MRLIKATIENFRGIKTKQEIRFNGFDVLIGRNDAGKSTVLKAIDLFLNNEDSSSDMLNRSADSKNVTIELFFKPNNTPIVIDDNVPTTFEAEELVDSDGQLRIKKTWDTEKTRISPETFIFRKIYGSGDFLMHTEAALIKECRQRNIETKKAGGEDFSNVEKRAKLRADYAKDAVAFTYGYGEKLPSTGASRGKEILGALTNALPRFEYFKADSSLSESDSAIQTYFRKLTVETAKQAGSSIVETKVKEQLTGVLSLITEKINKVVPEAEQVEPEVRFDWSKLLDVSFKSKTGGADIPLSLRGDGFRRITMMAYFEYLAEEKKAEKQNVVFGFEEPETFLHPSAQEQLFWKLEALTEKGYNVLVSTHSSIIVANAQRENLIHITKEGGYRAQQNVQRLDDIARDLGISVSNQFVSLFDKAKVLFLVEGPDDATALTHAAEEYKKCKNIPKTFRECDVAIIPIGGCGSIKHWVTLDLLKTLNKPYFILLDSDKTSAGEVSSNRQSLIDYGFAEGTDFLVTRKRCIENYMPSAALNRLVPGAALAYSDWDDVKQLCKINSHAAALGGGKVVSKQFNNLVFADLAGSFCYDAGKDEFLDWYSIVISKLPK